MLNVSWKWANDHAMRSFGSFVLGLLVAVGAAGESQAAQGGRIDQGQILFQDDFQKAEPGKLPAGYDVLDGKFCVQEKNGQKYLELPGTPLETFGVLFGPAFTPQTEGGMNVSGRVYGTRQGRRYPVFGVGLCGGGGYRLQVAPAKKALELCESDHVIASHPYTWNSATWTWLRLQILKKDGQWLLQGKAWPADQPEPDTWLLTQRLEQEPASGRPSLWGLPFSDQPIDFDDLAVRPAS